MNREAISQPLLPRAASLLQFRAILTCTTLALNSCSSKTPTPASSQVSGRVVDEQAHLPVANAIVTLRGATTSVRTDTAGRFRTVIPIQPGCNRLQVAGLGYTRTLVNFVTRSGTHLELGDIPLRGAAPLAGEAASLLMNRCEGPPITEEEAPWGVDTLRSNESAPM
jgi:hypothetical protein